MFGCVKLTHWASVKWGIIGSSNGLLPPNHCWLNFYEPLATNFVYLEWKWKKIFCGKCMLKYILQSTHETRVFGRMLSAYPRSVILIKRSWSRWFSVSKMFGVGVTGTANSVNDWNQSCHALLFSIAWSCHTWVTSNAACVIISVSLHWLK